MTVSEFSGGARSQRGTPSRYDAGVAASTARRAVGSPIPLRPASEDTSANAREVTRRIFLNLFEVLFKRPLLALLPLALLTVAGVLSAASGEETYRSESRIAVSSDALLAEITEARQTFSFETPATITSKQVNELLATDEFVSRVADAAGWGEALQNRQITLHQLRTMIYASADGDTLVRVGALTTDPEASQRLATAVVNSFRAYTIETGAAEASTTVEFLANELLTVQERSAAAIEAVDEFTAANPGVTADLPLALATEYQRLLDVAEEEATAVREANAALREARLRERETETVVDQRFRILDEPTTPEAAEPRLKRMVLEVAMFVVLGSILSVLLLLILAMFDRSIRTSSDVRRKFGLGVLALVPDRR